MAGEVGSNFTS